MSWMPSFLSLLEVYHSTVKLSSRFGGVAPKKMLMLLCLSMPKGFHGEALAGEMSIGVICLNRAPDLLESYEPLRRRSNLRWGSTTPSKADYDWCIFRLSISGKNKSHHEPRRGDDLSCPSSTQTSSSSPSLAKPNSLSILHRRRISNTKIFNYVLMKINEPNLFK